MDFSASQQQSNASNEYFDGSQPVSTPNPNKREIPGLAKIACDIKFDFFDDFNFRKCLETIRDSANRLFAGKGTEQDKAFVRLEIKSQIAAIAKGAYALAPKLVPQNYFDKLDKLIRDAAIPQEESEPRVV